MLLKEAALPSPENENYACRQYIFEQFSLEVVGKSSSTEEISLLPGSGSLISKFRSHASMLSSDLRTDVLNIASLYCLTMQI